MFGKIFDIFAGGFLGFSSGIAVAFGISAFVITTGLFPRIIQKTETADKTKIYENIILFGTVFGCVASMIPEKIKMWAPGGTIGIICLLLAGLFGGIFTGCLAVALAEVLNVIPIMFRVIKPAGSGEWVLLCLALGKVAGSIYYFRKILL